MLLNAFIARRYLFSKKSHNAINIITAIAVMGIGVATAAMICVMSVFNGFRDLVSSLYTTFDPELVVVPTKGKFAQLMSDAFSQFETQSGGVGVDVAHDFFAAFRGKDA